AAVLGAKNRELAAANTNERAAADRERGAADDARRTIEAMTSEDALAFLETQQGGLRPGQRRSLEQAVAYYRRYVGDAAAAGDLARAAQAYSRMGYLQARLGLHGEAEAADRAAVAEYERLAAAYPDVPEYRRQLARSHNDLGFMLADQGQ